MDEHNQKQFQSNFLRESTPEMGGGLPVLKYWVENTLSPEGLQLWKSLLHKSACLSCSWGTGGQKGGFTNEEGETLQRCMKSVESILSEIQPPIKTNFFEEQSINQLQQLTSLEADRLGRWSFPVILSPGNTHYQKISWEKIYQLAEKAFKITPERVASYSSGRSSNRHLPKTIKPW